MKNFLTYVVFALENSLNPLQSGTTELSIIRDFQIHIFFISNRVAKAQALKMGLKLMAISRKKAFFQTLINEVDCTLPEIQFNGLIFIGVTKFFPEFVLKGLS